MIDAVEDPSTREALQSYELQARHHQQRLLERLQSLGESVYPESRAAGNGRQRPPSGAAASSGQRGKPMSALDGLLATRLKIASYELLEATAARAGDSQTALVARWNRGDEEALSQTLAANASALEDICEKAPEDGNV